MAEVASAYVTLIPSARGFARGIQGQIGSDLNRAGLRGGQDFGAGMKSGVAGVASKVFAPLAIAAAGLGLGKILSDSITAGSDLQQGLGGVEAVFKSDAASIKTSAKEAADALGLPMTAYLDLATVLGAGLKNKGVKDFAGATQDLITIGADLAAQFGGPTSQAVEAIASALRGESDPIEKYGVALNEAAVNAELAAQGVKKGKGGFTEQQKTMARLAIITKQTADAQGAFARESDTYAGSQARLSSNWENIKTQIGSALLPALTDLSQWFLTKGLPAVKEFGGWVKDELWPALKDGWETVRPGLEKAKDIIMGAFGGEASGSIEGFARWITDTLIPAIADFVNVYLPLWATQIRVIIETVKAAWETFIVWRDTVATVAADILGFLIGVTEGFQRMLETLGKVPGFGWAKTAAENMQGAIDKAKGIKTALENIPLKREIEIIAQLTTRGRIEANGKQVNVGLRAAGGPIKAGQPYIVGERGPELVVPSKNGHVIPNHKAFGDGPKGLPGSGDGIDYRRLAAVLHDTMRGTAFAVDTRDNALATARHQNARGQM